MTSPEYFAKLREHILSGRRPSSEHEHLDSIAFWRKAYEESEVAQAKLLDKIYELEQRHALDQDKCDLFDLPRGPERPALPGLGRRKRGSEPTARANSQSKRRAVSARTSNTADKDLPVPGSVLQANVPGVAEGTPAYVLLTKRSLTPLQTLLHCFDTSSI